MSHSATRAIASGSYQGCTARGMTSCPRPIRAIADARTRTFGRPEIGVLLPSIQMRLRFFSSAVSGSTRRGARRRAGRACLDDDASGAGTADDSNGKASGEDPPCRFRKPTAEREIIRGPMPYRSVAQIRSSPPTAMTDASGARRWPSSPRTRPNNSPSGSNQAILHVRLRGSSRQMRTAPGPIRHQSVRTVDSRRHGREL